MEWAIALLVIAVLGVAAAIAAGGVGEMKSDPVRDTYRQDLPDRPLTAADVQELRFGIALRGYAMDQVDDVLARLSHEIAERDALIAELTAPNPDHRGADAQDPDAQDPDAQDPDARGADAGGADAVSAAAAGPGAGRTAAEEGTVAR